MQTKVCTKCGIEKDISEFYNLKNGKYGVESVCKLCKKSPSARRDFLVPNGFKLCPICNKEKALSEFYKDTNVKSCTVAICKICDKIKYKERRQNWRNGHREVAKNNQLKRDYGITLEQYNQMFKDQNGLCAICGKSETHKNQFGVINLAVDHNHHTGKIRDLLCAKCNQAIGLFQENSDVCFIAGKYLLKHKA